MRRALEGSGPDMTTDISDELLPALARSFGYFASDEDNQAQIVEFLEGKAKEIRMLKDEIRATEGGRCTGCRIGGIRHPGQEPRRRDLRRRVNVNGVRQGIGTYRLPIGYEYSGE